MKIAGIALVFAALVGIAFYATYALFSSSRTPEASTATTAAPQVIGTPNFSAVPWENFKGPTGPPNVKGPSGPPPNY